MSKSTCQVFDFVFYPLVQKGHAIFGVKRERGLVTIQIGLFNGNTANEPRQHLSCVNFVGEEQMVIAEVLRVVQFLHALIKVNSVYLQSGNYLRCLVHSLGSGCRKGSWVLSWFVPNTQAPQDAVNEHRSRELLGRLYFIWDLTTLWTRRGTSLTIQLSLNRLKEEHHLPCCEQLRWKFLHMGFLYLATYLSTSFFLHNQLHEGQAIAIPVFARRIELLFVC